MKIATRAAAAGLYSPSPEFRLRVEKSMRIRHQPIWKIPWVQALAAAVVALLLIVVSVSMVRRHSARSEALTQLLDVHIATTASSNPVDVLSTDQHTVKPWFQGKLPFTFNLPDLQESQFKLLGGRLIYFKHTPGAQVVYDLRRHEISVFILQDQPGITPPGMGISNAREKGFSMETWSEAGLRYVVIGDATPADVYNLGELLRAAGRQ
jgi:anti-sigma factor RsiW